MVNVIRISGLNRCIEREQSCILRRPARIVGGSHQWLHAALGVSLLLAGGLAVFAQPKGQPEGPVRLSPTEAVKQGGVLVEQLLAAFPEPVTNRATLRIRSPGGAEQEILAQFSIYITPSNWVSTYEALSAPAQFKTMRLTVVHTPGKPNEYLLAEHAQQGTPDSGARKLSGAETMYPFADSQFWVADLGLEFLHWPKQLLLRKELRRSQSCDVLESVNPVPTKGGYSRVVSWIDIDTGGIVHADAYDDRNALLKQFDPTALQKVNGHRELKEMEIRNRQTGARSWITFDLGRQ
jgi:hypothetical protein